MSNKYRIVETKDFHGDARFYLQKRSWFGYWRNFDRDRSYYPGGFSSTAIYGNLDSAARQLKYYTARNLNFKRIHKCPQN